MEVFFPASLTGCSLPDLPAPNRLASQSGGVMCGGENPRYSHSCHSFTDQGTWTESHQLLTERVVHSSWTTSQGILLMGGRVSELTTELGTEKTDQERQFQESNL